MCGHVSRISLDGLKKKRDRCGVTGAVVARNVCLAFFNKHLSEGVGIAIKIIPWITSNSGCVSNLLVQMYMCLVLTHACEEAIIFFVVFTFDLLNKVVFLFSYQIISKSLFTLLFTL